MPWLVTYKQLSNHGPDGWLTQTCATDQHPADWLVEVKQEYPEKRFSVVFAMEISDEQHQRMVNAGF